jgi:hypothetical protein
MAMPEKVVVELPFRLAAELARAAYVRNIELPFDQEMVAEELQ